MPYCKAGGKSSSLFTSSKIWLTQIKLIIYFWRTSLAGLSAVLLWDRWGQGGSTALPGISSWWKSILAIPSYWVASLHLGLGHAHYKRSHLSDLPRTKLSFELSLHIKNIIHIYTNRFVKIWSFPSRLHWLTATGAVKVTESIQFSGFDPRKVFNNGSIRWDSKSL